MNKDVKHFLRELTKLGYQVDRTRSDHYRVSIGGKVVATIGGTPSDPRWKKNTLRDMRKAGAW